MDKHDRLIGLQEICDFLDVSATTVRRWRKEPPNGRGPIPITVLGERIEARKSKLAKWRDCE